MKPLIVLIAAFVLALVGIKVVGGSFDYRLAGRIAMAVMLAFTAMGHFAFTKGMEMMLPERLPFKKGMVIATGVLEVLAAIGLLVPGFENLTGRMLIVFFILIVPANISAAIRHVDYQKGTYEGPGVKYLWFRVPLQVLFIVWVYVCAVR